MSQASVAASGYYYSAISKKCKRQGAKYEEPARELRSKNLSKGLMTRVPLIESLQYSPEIGK